MKKTTLLITIILLVFANIVSAQEESTEDSVSPTQKPTVKQDQPSPTKSTVDKIQEIKDKVASRVAELKKEKLSAISGTLKSSSEAALVLVVDGADYTVQLDEEAKVYSVSNALRKSEKKLTDIEKNTHLSVVGTIDKEEKTAIAKVIVEKTPALSLIGSVSEVSSKDGTIMINSTDNKTFTVDIEVSTKSNAYDIKSGELVKVGLSKIETGSKIHVYGTSGESEERITASRILILPKEFPEVPPTQPPTPTSEVKEETTVPTATTAPSQ